MICWLFQYATIFDNTPTIHFKFGFNVCLFFLSTIQYVCFSFSSSSLSVFCWCWCGRCRPNATCNRYNVQIVLYGNDSDWNRNHACHALQNRNCLHKNDATMTTATTANDDRLGENLFFFVFVIITAIISSRSMSIHYHLIGSTLEYAVFNAGHCVDSPSVPFASNCCIQFCDRRTFFSAFKLPDETENKQKQIAFELPRDLLYKW